MTMILSNPRERTRFLRFAAVGLFGAVVDFGTYSILNDLVGVPAVPASVCSFIAAVISNFLWNRYWTYPDSRSKPIQRQITEFTVVSGIGLAIRTPIFALLVKPTSNLFASLPPLPFMAQDFLGDKVALGIAVIVVMFWNFFVNRYWTYGDVE